MEKKAKKIALRLAEATTIEVLKELIRRLLRRKPSEVAGEVPCSIVDRFKSYYLEEFEPFFSRANSQNIISIIHQVCSPIGKQSEINKRLNQLERDYEWVEREYLDAMLAFRDYEEYGYEEFFKEPQNDFLKPSRNTLTWQNILMNCF